MCLPLPRVVSTIGVAGAIVVMKDEAAASGSVASSCWTFLVPGSRGGHHRTAAGSPSLQPNSPSANGTTLVVLHIVHQQPRKSINLVVWSSAVALALVRRRHAGKGYAYWPCSRTITVLRQLCRVSGDDIDYVA